MCEQKRAADSKADRLINELSTMNGLLRELVQRFDARNVLIEVPVVRPDLAEIIAPLLRDHQGGPLKATSDVR